MYFDHGVLVFKLPIGTWLQKLDMYFFWEQKKWLEKTVVPVLGYCFFLQPYLPPKNGKTFRLGISGNSFLCRACNKATRSHSSTVSSRSTAIATGASPVVVSTNHDNHTTNTSQVTQDFFWGEVQATLFCFKFPTFSVCLLDRTKTRTVPEWQKSTFRLGTQALMHPGDVESATP